MATQDKETDHNASIKLNDAGFELAARVAIHPEIIEPLTFTCAHRVASGETAYAFASEDITATVTITPTDSGVYCRLSAKIANESLFVPVKSFASIGAVRLSIKPTSNITGVMGSRYTILTCWAGPFFADGFEGIPRDVASLVWRTESSYFHMLPLCDGDFRSDLHGSGETLDVWVSSFCPGATKIDAASIVLCTGDDPFELAERTTSSGFDALGKRRVLRRDKPLSPMFDYLGWCSWDAFHRDVSAAGLLAKAEEVRRIGVPIKWFLIDDGWSQTRDQKLLDFTEDREKFPQGLKSVVTELKRRLGVAYVGAWQNFMGYWEGIHPDGVLAHERRELLYETANGRIMPRPDEPGSYGFWDEWHSYLREQGIDFIKSDSQSTVSVFVQDDIPLGRAVRALHRGMEASARANFDGAVINCTGMGHETTWHHTEGIISRNSVDYNPQAPESMRAFITQNVYNSFYYSQIYHTDWDMWWSQSPTTKLSAVLHAVSGGIVYLSDRVGETDPASVLPFVLPDGRLLRCDSQGMPTEDALFTDPTKHPLPLKVWNTVGSGGVIAAFNVYDGGGSVRGTIRVSDIPELLGERFAVFDWYARRCTVVTATEPYPIEIAEDDAALFIVQPVDEVLSPLGLIDKYIPQAAIKFSLNLPLRQALLLHCGGELAYVADAEHAVSINGNTATPESRDGFFVVDCSKHEGTVFVELSLL